MLRGCGTFFEQAASLSSFFLFVLGLLAQLFLRLIMLAYSIPILWRLSLRCRPPFLKIFSSETDWPIKAKISSGAPLKGETKVCINGSCRMTKITATPINGKTYKEPEIQ